MVGASFFFAGLADEKQLGQFRVFFYFKTPLFPMTPNIFSALARSLEIKCKFNVKQIFVKKKEF